MSCLYPPFPPSVSMVQKASACAETQLCVCKGWLNSAIKANKWLSFAQTLRQIVFTSLFDGIRFQLSLVRLCTNPIFCSQRYSKFLKQRKNMKESERFHSLSEPLPSPNKCVYVDFA